MPRLTLDNGGVANYTGQDGSGNLLFTYTVVAGQITPDLRVAGFDLNGATVLGQIDTDMLGALTPADAGFSDGLPFEMGTEFKPGVDGTIASIKFYKSPSETGSHTGHIWSASGQLLATAAFSSETASGWQVAQLSTPFAVQAGNDYVVSINVNDYYVDTYYGLQNPVGSEYIATDGPNNGLFGLPGTFPTQTYENSNYFEDIGFSASVPLDASAVPTLAGADTGITVSDTTTITRNAASGNWNAALNWTPNVVPTAVDDAVLDAAGTYEVTVDHAEAARSVTLAATGATLTIAPGGTLAVGGPLALEAGRLNLAGTIRGGRIVAGDATVNYQSGGALDGTTFAGTLDLSHDAPGQQATGLLNGATVQAADGGRGLILATGGNSSIGFGGSTPGIDNVTIEAGGVGNTAYIVVTGTTVFGNNTTLAQTNPGSTVVVYGAGWMNNGAIGVSAPGAVMDVTNFALTNNGMITVENGGSLVAADNQYNPGGAFTNDGVVNLATGGTLRLVHDAAGSGIVNFFDGSGRLVLDASGPSAPTSVSLSIAGFRQGDTIDLTHTNADAVSFANNVLTVFDNGSAVAALHLLGSYASSQFVLTPDGSTGTFLTTFPTPPASPSDLALAPESDSGIPADGLTNVATPTLTGTAPADAAITLYDGATVLGAATADDIGAWSCTVGTALAQGRHDITATATDDAGNTSAPSAALALTIDTTRPTVTAEAATNPAHPLAQAPLLTGTAEAGAAIIVTAGNAVVGTAAADPNGKWSWDPMSLAPGTHTLVASETDAAGNMGSSGPVTLTVPPARFVKLNDTTTAGAYYGADYTGPVIGLKEQYSYDGPGNVVLGAQVADVFLRASGSGADALAAEAGSNVLDGAASSNWLVGAPGTDGGNDTFFLHGAGGQQAWDTLVNFHVGDMLTLWGFEAASGRTSWSDGMGASGFAGATLHVAFGDTAQAAALVTFAGLGTGSAQFTTSTGSVGGLDYLAVTRTV